MQYSRLRPWLSALGTSCTWYLLFSHTQIGIHKQRLYAPTKNGHSLSKQRTHMPSLRMDTPWENKEDRA